MSRGWIKSLPLENQPPIYSLLFTGLGLGCRCWKELETLPAHIGIAFLYYGETWQTVGPLAVQTCLNDGGTGEIGRSIAPSSAVTDSMEHGREFRA